MMPQINPWAQAPGRALKSFTISTTIPPITVLKISFRHPVGISLLAAFGAGMLAGLVTGLLHTVMGIPAILSGIRLPEPQCRWKA